MIEIRQLVWMTGDTSNSRFQYRFRWPKGHQLIYGYFPQDWEFSEWHDVEMKILDSEPEKNYQDGLKYITDIKKPLA